MVAASPGGEFAAVRGTSFASPLVAGLIARLLEKDDAAGVEQVVQQLAATAAERSGSRRDRRSGYLVGMELRTDPGTIRGASVARIG